MKIDRDELKIIYASSYDRGLEHLLDIWTDVYKETNARIGKYPSLHIFYGWNLFDFIQGNNPERMEWKKKMNEKMKQDGIFHHGRVSHEELILNFKTAGIWAYPTHFGEISCQVGMMAQAYGAIPVIVDYAALKETVKFGDKIEGDIYDPKVLGKFREVLVHRLHRNVKVTDETETFRDEMMKWAKHEFTWAFVARDWQEKLLT